MCSPRKFLPELGSGCAKFPEERLRGTPETDQQGPSRGHAPWNLPMYIVSAEKARNLRMMAPVGGADRERERMKLQRNAGKVNVRVKNATTLLDLLG